MKVTDCTGILNVVNYRTFVAGHEKYCVRMGKVRFKSSGELAQNYPHLAIDLKMS